MKYLFILPGFFLYHPVLKALTPPALLALGGGGQALSGRSSTDHLLNPASLMYTQNQVSGYYSFGDIPAPYWGLSLTESSQLPLAFSFIKSGGSPSSKLAVSTATFILPQISMGLTASRRNEKNDIHWNIHSGLLINQKDSWAVGAVWNYMLAPARKVQKNRGLAFHYPLNPWFHIQADALYYSFHPHGRWFLIGGGEWRISKFLNFYIAARWNAMKNTWLYSGRGGLKGDSLEVYYSINQDDAGGIIQGFFIEFSQSKKSR